MKKSKTAYCSSNNKAFSYWYLKVKSKECIHALHLPDKKILKKLAHQNQNLDTLQIGKQEIKQYVNTWP